MEVHVELAAEKLFDLGPIPVTNSLVTMLAVMAIILLVFSSIARKASVVPGRGQGFLEVIVEFLLGLVEGTAGKRIGRRIFPLIAGIFIFIAFSNYSGLLPGVGTIGIYRVPEAEVEAGGEEDGGAETTTEGGEGTTGEEGGRETVSTPAGGEAALEVASIGPVDPAPVARAAEAGEKVLVPFLRAPNADLNMTLAMALITFFVVQVAGVQAHGVAGRIKHMAQPWWIFPLEVIQEFARIISLSFRLFGNIFAGEVLLAVMYAMAAAIKIALIPVLFPVIFLFLEVLFGTIQALVFSLLTLIYITLAASGHDDHGEEHAHAPARGGAATAHGTAD